MPRSSAFQGQVMPRPLRGLIRDLVVKIKRLVLEPRAQKGGTRPTAVASGRTGVRAGAAILLRPRATVRQESAFKGTHGGSSSAVLEIRNFAGLLG